MNGNRALPMKTKLSTHRLIQETLALIGRAHQPLKNGMVLSTVKTSECVFQRPRCLWHQPDYDEVIRTIDPLQHSDFQGVDMYLEAIEFVQERASNM